MSPMVLAVASGWAALVAWPVVHAGRRADLRRRAVALPERSPSAAPPPRHARWRATGPVARVLTSFWRRARRRAHTRALEGAVPLTLDVVTMAARAGLTPRLALGATVRWGPTPVRDALAAVEHRCGVGASFASSLDALAAAEPALAELADVLAVADRDGAPTAELLGRLADEARAAFRRRAQAHAQRVPVRLLFPLVFLVLPAFGLLTVVPALLAGLRNT